MCLLTLCVSDGCFGRMMCLGHVLGVCRSHWYFETGLLNFFLNLQFRNTRSGRDTSVKIQENKDFQKVLHQLSRPLGVVRGVILIAWNGSFGPLAVPRGSFRPKFQTA